MNNAEEVVKNANRVKKLTQSVFNTSQGQELMKDLKKIYCDGRLYCNNDRDTVYFIAQRDLIIELSDNANSSINGEKPNGEEIS